MKQKINIIILFHLFTIYENKIKQTSQIENKKIKKNVIKYTKCQINIEKKKY